VSGTKQVSSLVLFGFVLASSAAVFRGQTAPKPNQQVKPNPTQQSAPDALPNTVTIDNPTDTDAILELLGAWRIPAHAATGV